MKAAFHCLLLLVAIGIGLALGAAVRAARTVAPISPPTTPFAPGASSGSSSNSLRPSHWPTGVRRPDDSPLATQLQRDLSMSTGVTQWLHWLDALEKAAPTDFPRLLRLAKSNPTAAGLVKARWIEIAPRQLFDLVVAGSKERPDLPIDDLAY